MTMPDSRKSARPENTGAIGIASRGKYTLVMNATFEVIEFAALVMPYRKNVHGSRPEKENSGYGNSLMLLVWPALLMMRANTTIVRTGCRIAHMAPSAVC